MQRVFWALLGCVLLIKLVIAAQLPLFVDEAFYWQEGQHLAAAYSDLPGLTAWLTRLGVTVGGDSKLALRLPFLLLATLVPWLVVRLTRRALGEGVAWTAGCFAVLLPLSGTLGLLALPDAAMAVATLVCVKAGVRLLREVSAGAALELALGLCIGALSHYRFIAVIAVGFVALLLLPDGRRALRDVRVLTALALGACAWLPLLAWNLDNADAGLRFQLVDRHPWAFHADGLWFVAIQALLVTPLLFLAMAWASARNAWVEHSPSRYFALLGGLVVLGFFALGFFADTERVSFHWPLPGYLALLPLVPDVLRRWPRAWRITTWAMAVAGLLSMLGYYVMVSRPTVRAHTAAEKWYPGNFAGWDAVADAVRSELAQMPAGTQVVADNFKLGAELGFALGDANVPVLDHPLNHKHGRAPQLQLWKLHSRGRVEWGTKPVLLVVGVSEVPYKQLLQRYHALCEMVGPLPPPRVVNVDHGRQRFAIFRLLDSPAGACTTPALGWFDTPASDARVRGRIDLKGWAFKDGVGLTKAELLLDGVVVAGLNYGVSDTGVAAYWEGSTDPSHPRVGFTGTLDLSGVAKGRHWLGLRLHGADGSVEDWSEQPLQVE